MELILSSQTCEKIPNTAANIPMHGNGHWWYYIDVWVNIAIFGQRLSHQITTCTRCAIFQMYVRFSTWKQQLHVCIGSGLALPTKRQNTQKHESWWKIRRRQLLLMLRFPLTAPKIHRCALSCFPTVQWVLLYRFLKRYEFNIARK